MDSDVVVIGPSCDAVIVISRVGVARLVAC